MTHGGFHQQRFSPTSFGIVLALHGAAVAALMLAKGPDIAPHIFAPTKVAFVPAPPPPPKILPEPPPVERQASQPSRVTFVPPVIDLPRAPSELVADPSPRPAPLPVNNGPVVIAEPGPVALPEPAAVPVRVEASVDPRFARDLQPPYPAAEQRAGNEGEVAIRVTIGTDGRVVAAQKVRATSDAFYRATERQALARWRFRPATLDGRPVESTKLMTVYFTLD